MKSINPRKALALGGLLIVTLAAGCAGGQGWSNDPYSYNGGGNWGSSYPNLNSSGGPYPSTSVYRSDVPSDNNHAYASEVNDSNPPSRDRSETYGRVNVDRHQEPQADRHADDRSASAER
jgi:hypothetical protein